MAWTQAARDAAAAARKAHAGQKTAFKDMGKRNIVADTSKEGRSELAKRLKSMRKPNSFSPSGKHGDYLLHDSMAQAAASTRLRNLNKQGGGMKHAKAASKSRK
jgi:hypothetical protein